MATVFGCGKGLEVLLDSNRNLAHKQRVPEKEEQQEQATEEDSQSVEETEENDQHAFQEIPLVVSRLKRSKRRRVLRRETTRVKHVACGSSFVILVTDDDDIYMMGNNQYGQLGLGSAGKSKSPATDNCTEQEGASDEMASQQHHMDVFDRFIHVNDLNVEVKLVACGANHTLLVTNDNEVYACGANMFGECGLGHFNEVDTFQKLDMSGDFSPNNDNIQIEQVTCGSEHSFIRTSNHELWCCGQNYAGQLGTGSLVNENVFVRVKLMMVEQATVGQEDSHDASQDAQTETQEETHDEIVPLKQVSCGDNHTVVLTMDNELWACGSNMHGALGLLPSSSSDSTSTPKAQNQDFLSKFVKLTIRHIIGRSIISSIYCGETHTVLLTEDGQLYVCGSSQRGALALDGINFAREFQRVPIKPLHGASLPMNSSPVDATVIMFKNRDFIMACGNNSQHSLGLDTHSCEVGRLRKVTLDIDANTSDTCIQQLAIGPLMSFAVLGPMSEQRETATSTSINMRRGEAQVSVPAVAETPMAIELLRQEVHQKALEIERLQKQIASGLGGAGIQTESTVNAVPVEEPSKQDLFSVLGAWMIDKSDITIDNQISTTESLGTWSGTPILVKELPPSMTQSLKPARLIELINIRHPNCQQYLGFSMTDDRQRIHIICDCLSLTNLKEFLHVSTGKLSVYVRLRIALEIARGIAYLHSRQPSIVHGNLGAESIYLNQSVSTVKIGDYKLVLDESTDSLANDVYQFGIILQEIWFWNIEEINEHRNSLQGPILTLIHSCKFDVEHRPNIATVFEQLQRVMSTIHPM